MTINFNNKLKAPYLGFFPYGSIRQVSRLHYKEEMKDFKLFRPQKEYLKQTS